MELKLTGVRAALGGKEILHGVDLTVRDGELLALLGASGCGKSTCLKSIAGIVPLSGGSISLGEEDLSALPPHRRGVVVVFQDLRLFPHLTAAENVAFPLRMRGVSRQKRLEEAGHWLERVQLAGLDKRKVGQLSGGQLQRVALARALAAQPRVLLLDEPFSSLDENLREDMRALVRTLQAQLHMTTVLVTHDRREALSMAHRVAVMFDGSVEQCGSPREVYAAPATRRVADYFGGGGYLPGRVRDGVFSAGELSFPAAVPDGAWDAFLRPDALKLGGGPLPLTVAETAYLGESYQTTLTGPEGFRLSLTAPKPLGPVGQTVLTGVDGAQAVLFPHTI